MKTKKPTDQSFPDITLVKVADLKMDPAYQRATSRRRAKKIADDFNVHLFDPITIAWRNGDWWIVDGGHRTLAAQLAGIDFIPAVVSDTRSVREDAGLFSLKNDGQKPLSPSERFRADVVAGVRDASDIQRAFTVYGWRLGVDIRCVGTIRKVYRVHGREPVMRALRLLRNVMSPTGGDVAETWLVTGTMVLLAVHPEADDARTADVISRRYVEIRRNVMARGDSGGAGTRGSIGAESLRDAYNKGLHGTSKRRLDITRPVPRGA